MPTRHNRSLRRSALATALSSAIVLSGTTFAQEQQTDQGSPELEAKELDAVVVTARKRTESIMEVPMNITAISAEELTSRNLTSVEEIYRTIAGGASATGQLILRGLSGSNSPSPDTTSQFVDGVPFESSNIFDVDRVEVLRGPQGTLWGSNAIGGTVQIITNKPRVNDFEIFSTLRASNESDVPGLAKRFEFGANAPLIEDKLALRVAGSTYRTPGKIVNAATGTQRSISGELLRMQLQWEPTEDTRFNLGYINQKSRTEGTRLADRSQPGGYYVPNFTENPDSPWGYDVDYDVVSCDATWERPACFTDGNPGVDAPSRYTIYEIMDPWSKSGTDLFSLTFEHDDLFGIASASYVGSWREIKDDSLDNWSRLDMADMMKTWIINHNKTNRVTHELRFQSNERRGGFDWTVGLFQDRDWEGYNPNAQWQYHEITPQGIALFSDWNDWAWFDPAWAAQGIHNVGDLGRILYGDPSKNYNLTYHHVSSKEEAAFGELSYSFDAGSGRIEITGGIRYFRLDDATSYTQSGIWIGPEANTATTGGQESGNRKKLSVAWIPNSDMNLYALYSEGYRPGGNNGPLPNACLDDEFAPSHRDRYTSDKIDNYELGFKGNLWDRRLRIASAIYQIDWTDVRTSIYMPTCGFSFTANAANARSRGVELESQAWLGNNTTLTFNAAYTDSTMLDDVPALGAKAGDDMTMVPKYNGYLALDHGFNLFDRDASARIDVATYGPFKSHFNVRDEDRTAGYTTINLSGRIHLNDDVSLGLFANNLLNKEYVTYRSARSRTSSSQPLNEIYGDGRTIGMRLDMRFE
ncbi:TonB-dependent receptor [Luteimonas suaedae]|uniref:TonB-dependent receptor n=1 Tax=Luteimonas suaedae TaxID=2605430 RepID=UPI0011EF42BF|nr:TonB-dependent receptor [Luteimonas suaedae]